MGQQHAASSHELFTITIPERETIGAPVDVADDLGRKSIAFVSEGKDDVVVMPPMIPQDAPSG